MSFICGIDGGGTSTKVLLRHDDGRTLDRRFGPFNINSIGPAGLERLLAEITDFLRTQGVCRALCIGAAGMSNEQVRQIVQAAMERAGISTCLLVGDHDIALRGALGREPGMALIAGTGSICLGVNAAGETKRVGGWGHLIGDEGSGYALGAAAVTALTHAMDGTGPQTLLCEKMKAWFDPCSRDSLVRYVYGGDKSRLAALAPAVLDAARCGDAVAGVIVEQNVRALCQMVQAVFKPLGFKEAKVALLGGLWDDASYTDCLRRHLKESEPQVVCVRPAASAVEGALDMACDLIGEEQDGF